MLRVNLTFTSTPRLPDCSTRKTSTNGFFGAHPFRSTRLVASVVARFHDRERIMRNFLKKLDGYLLRLDNCKGSFVVKQLNKVADQLAEEMARLADLADDDMLWELSHRSIFSAWKKGAVLWILNDQTWTTLHRRVRDMVLLL